LHHNVITPQRRTNPTKRKRRKIDNIYFQLIPRADVIGRKVNLFNAKYEILAKVLLKIQIL